MSKTAAELEKMARQAEVDWRWNDAAELWKQAIAVHDASAKRTVEEMRSRMLSARMRA